MKARSRSRVSPSLVVALTYLLIATAPDWSAGVAATPGGGTRAARSGGYWFKGNTHAHSNWSGDGDSAPSDVAQWYRTHGYDFVVVTDHNILTPAADRDSSDRFLVMQGEEITDQFEGRPLHVNGIGIATAIAPQGGASVADTLRNNASAVRTAGGLAIVNHPNYITSIGARVLSDIASGSLFELFNAQQVTRSLGAPGIPGMEAVWDEILSRGKVVFGVAADDAHTLKTWSNIDPHRPGGGWVVVHATGLNAPSIVNALARGDFYASTGIELNDYLVTDAGITLDIHALASRTYRTQFIGPNGRVLAESSGTSASYDFRREDELYVRAKIEDSTGAIAWTQPVFPNHHAPN